MSTEKYLKADILATERYQLKIMAVRIAWVITTCGLVSVLSWPLRDALDPANIAMLYLLAVALVAMRAGKYAAFAAAFLSTGLLDFFFIHPRFTFTVGDMQHMVTLAVMLVVALIISNLTVILQQKIAAAIEREEQSQALYKLASQLAGTTSQEQVAAATRQFLHLAQGARSILLIYRDDILHPVEPDHRIDSGLQSVVAFSALRKAQTSPLYDDPRYWLFLPLQGSTYIRGVLAIDFGEAAIVSINAQQALYEAIASLVSIAIERLHFVEIAQRAQLQMTDERLRSSILAALSHDIRTPLTVLYGMTDTLSQTELSPKARDMIAAIREQTIRLNNMVSNILDMAKLQAGSIRMNLEWQPLEEVIGSSIKLLGTALAQHPVKVQLPSDLPLLRFDAVLMERVLCNLLENAAKYSPAGSTIMLCALIEDDKAIISVCDSGIGFPPNKLDKVFELFERGDAESIIPGMGLGLAICRSIVEAHGGKIKTENCNGACVTFTLPLGEPPFIDLEERDE
jgi:two-component system sensor histidine kinase KdpD